MIEQFAKWFFGPDIWSLSLGLTPFFFIFLIVTYLAYKDGAFR